MSPESIKENKYSLTSDVWSFSVLIIEILTREIPYPNLNSLKVVS